VEFKTSDAVSYFYIDMGLIRIEISSEDVPDRHHAIMLAPSNMVCLAITHS
jgi:hypothetical protein